VFALGLTGRKFAKNAAKWIRRKFSIDGDSRALDTKTARARFRNHENAGAETRCSPSASIGSNGARKNLDKSATKLVNAAALAFV
jgi:hypothetical protein